MWNRNEQSFAVITHHHLLFFPTNNKQASHFSVSFIFKEVGKVMGVIQLQFMSGKCRVSFLWIRCTEEIGHAFCVCESLSEFSSAMQERACRALCCCIFLCQCSEELIEQGHTNQLGYLFIFAPKGMCTTHPEAQEKVKAVLTQKAIYVTWQNRNEY